MWSNKHFLAAIVLFSIVLSANSQSLTTYSPYSKFGVGEMRTRGYANTKGMGGLTQGIRNGTWINYLNPASYTSQDTMSLVFDFGVEGDGVGSKSGQQSNYNTTANIHHLAIQFPVTRWFGASAGIQPFSKVGYRIKHVETRPDILSQIGAIKYYHLGSGGISQFYVGAAVEPLKNLSIGVNMSYLFGGLEYNSEVVFPDYSQYASIQKINSVMVRDIAFSFGVQNTHFFGSEKQYKLVLGATLDNETAIGAQRIEYITFTSGGSNDTISYNEYPKGSLDYPKNLSAGFTFSYKNNFLVGFDYGTQDWTNARFLNATDSLTKSQSFRGGVQITPNPYDLRYYYKRVSYRLGYHYTNTSIQLNGNQIKDYGISFGVGLPFRRTNSSFSFSFELGRKGTLKDNLVQETYGIINVGFSFYDIWFVKRKYN
jgi:hypothetical protein